MEANPYQAPQSIVQDAPKVLTSSAIAPTFAVSITKFSVMAFATGGLYVMYWFYQHWVAVRRRTNDSIWPVWRAIFGLIWCYALLSDIHEQARKQRVERWISVGSLTAGFVITSLIYRAPDPWGWLSMFAFVFLIPSQREANELNAKMAPDADRNSHFTWANVTWLCFMVAFWGLVVLAYTLPAEG